MSVIRGVRIFSNRTESARADPKVTLLSLLNNAIYYILHVKVVCSAHICVGFLFQQVALVCMDDAIEVHFDVIITSH